MAEVLAELVLLKLVGKCDACGVGCMPNGGACPAHGVRGTHVSLVLNACNVCSACVARVARGDGSARIACDLIIVPIGRVVCDAYGVLGKSAACVGRDTCGVHVVIAVSKGWLV